jgi:hypothetical protein
MDNFNVLQSSGEVEPRSLDLLIWAVAVLVHLLQLDLRTSSCVVGEPVSRTETKTGKGPVTVRDPTADVVRNHDVTPLCTMEIRRSDVDRSHSVFLQSEEDLD